jgi:ABC-type dipeptide/oligopeptide/nickel transport system ATPase component
MQCLNSIRSLLKTSFSRSDLLKKACFAACRTRNCVETEENNRFFEVPIGQSADTILDVKNLTVDFLMPNGTKIRAVDNFNCVIRRGKINALVGESGCGKSTAANVIMGIAAPNAEIVNGEIILCGVNTLTLPLKKRRAFIAKQAGMIFQEAADSLDPIMNIENQLIEALSVKKRTGKSKFRDMAAEQLRNVCIDNPKVLMGKYPFMLSGGMCQRVMIAMASIRNPSLLLADEPTTSLDVSIQAQILKYFDLMRGNNSSGILLITHDLGIVAEIADYVYVMRRGEIVDSGDVYEIFRTPKSSYTRELLDAAL